MILVSVETLDVGGLWRKNRNNFFIDPAEKTMRAFQIHWALRSQFTPTLGSCSMVKKQFQPWSRLTCKITIQYSRESNFNCKFHRQYLSTILIIKDLQSQRGFPALPSWIHQLHSLKCVSSSHKQTNKERNKRHAQQTISCLTTFEFIVVWESQPSKVGKMDAVESSIVSFPG